MKKIILSLILCLHTLTLQAQEERAADLMQLGAKSVVIIDVDTFRTPTGFSLLGTTTFRRAHRISSSLTPIANGTSTLLMEVDHPMNVILYRYPSGVYHGNMFLLPNDTLRAKLVEINGQRQLQFISGRSAEMSRFYQKRYLEVAKGHPELHFLKGGRSSAEIDSVLCELKSFNEREIPKHNLPAYFLKHLDAELEYLINPAIEVDDMSAAMPKHNTHKCTFRGNRALAFINEDALFSTGYYYGVTQAILNKVRKHQGICYPSRQEIDYVQIRRDKEGLLQCIIDSFVGIEKPLKAAEYLLLYTFLFYVFASWEDMGFATAMHNKFSEYITQEPLKRRLQEEYLKFEESLNKKK